jgi:hypothetical protein
MRRIIYYLLLATVSVGASEKAFNLKSGQYEVKISGKYKYTVRQIKYEGTIMGSQSGYYGTVMAHGKGKYVGAGHGEGGFEKVLNMTLTVDGKPITPVPGKTYGGKQIILSKVSMLDKLRFQTEISVTPDGIIERKRFVATAKQPMHLMYIYLLCWNKTTTDWTAESADGKSCSGEFGEEFKGRSRWHLQKDIKWVANYDAKAGKGMLMYYPAPIAGQGRKSAFWEVKNAYNKYYLMLKTPKIFPQGYESPLYTLVLKGFKADKQNFKNDVQKAIKKASKIKLEPMKKINIPDKQAANDTQTGKSLDSSVSFSADYTETTSTDASIDAKTAKGDKTGKVLYSSKPVFDFDNMAHTIRGLAVGKGGSTIKYNTVGNLTPEKGSIELVVKAFDWKWNDKKVHIFMQTSIPATKGTGKLYLYKYKTSGLALYLERTKTGEKVFLNCPVKNWKDKSWHHIAVTYSPDEVVLYVDGIRCKGAEFGTIKKWADLLYIGPASNKFGYDGKSTISFVNMYERPLTAKEVKALAKERLPDLKINISDDEAALIGKKIIGKNSPWFKNRPKLAMEALNDDTVLPPWYPVKYNSGKVSIWGRDYDFNGKDILNSITATGSSLLASPIQLEFSANSQKQVITFSAPEVVKQGKGKILLRRKALGGIDASLDYMIEFDGMIWNKLIIKPAKQKITGLKLIIPFTKATAKFIHYVGAPTVYESQDLPKNSLSRALADKQGSLYKSGFKTNVWIGDNNRGLLWFAESERSWWPKERNDMIEVFRNSNGSVDLRLNMVTAELPAAAKNGLLYEFGLMATPVKSLPTGWRGMTFSAQYDSIKGDRRGNNLIYWPNEWRWMMLDPEPHRAENVDYIRNKIKRDRKENRKIIPYWTRLHYPIKDNDKLNADAKKMQKAWSTIPGRPGGGSHQMYRAACTSEWTDYLVWCVDQWAKVMGHVDGVYIDETQPIPNSKALSGGGYTDLQGTRRPTFEIFGSRNMIKRMTYNIWQRNKTAPWSIAHCSATHTMQTLSAYTVMLIGEQYYSGYFTKNPEYLPPASDRLYYYSYALPMDRLRTECYWKQWGAVMVWLPCLKNQKDLMKNPIPTRDMLSRVMQADMLVWPLFCCSTEVYKTWKFRKEFGIADSGVTFTPYWENKNITSNGKDVIAGYYKNGNKYLVLVSNLNRKSKKVKLTFDGISLDSVKNAESLKTIKSAGNTVTLEIPRNDYIALRINY